MKIPFNNFYYKIVSVLLAVLLWYYVSQQANPLTEQVFDVPLEVKGLAQNLVVAEKPSLVKIRVQGQRQTLDDISPRDIQAFVDVGGLDVGQYSLEIRVILPAKTQFVSANPARANVFVDVVANRQVPVNVKFTGKLTAPGYMALTPILNPSEVLVSGPEDRLNNISRVYVEVNLAEATTSYRQRLPIKVEDHNGNMIQDWLDIAPAEVEVLVPVVSEVPGKAVPIKVPITGTPRNGFKIERVVPDPRIVTIYGDFVRLEAIDTLSTTEIDVNDASEDVVATVELLVPEGVTLAVEARATVVIKIDKRGQKTLTNVPLVLLNVPEGLQAVPSVTNVTVQIEGSDALVEKVTAGDVSAFVDLTNLEPGEKQVPIQVNLPRHLTLSRVTPENVSVKLE